MTDSSSGSNHTAARMPFGKLKAGGGLVGVLAVVYALLQPILSAKLGIDLPRLPVGSGSTTVASSDDGSPKAVPNQSQEKSGSRDTGSLNSKIQVRETTASSRDATVSQTTQSSNTQKSGKDSSNKGTSNSKPSDTGGGSSKASPTKSSSSKSGGPLSNRIRPPPESSSSQQSPAKSTPAKTNSSAKPTNPNLKYGILQSLGRDNYMSPAGLRYTPGSQEGHRLKHLERHTKDQPTRPGKHGVFDGGMEKTLQVLDQAYERAKKKQKTVTSQDRGRTIHTVDMGRRIGFIGGRDGNRMRKPMARRVRIVLEGNRVITAYPL